MKSCINELEVPMGLKDWSTEESNLERHKIADITTGSKC